MHLKKTSIQIIECPRDAMQGWSHFIATADKIRYINALLQVGFDTIDFGSFVSPKAIPQMADTKAVLAGLDMSNSISKLLAIVANKRGAAEAVISDAIKYIGFPFSISPTFQLRNTNTTMQESVALVDEIQELCIKNNKTLVIYLSMGFGNPYGDIYSEELLLQWADTMTQKQIEIISLADTVGMAQPAQITTALTTLIPAYANTVFGVHLHASPNNWKEKLLAAVNAGCTRIDGALKGIGGCPMAQDELVGNMDTLNILSALEPPIANMNATALAKAVSIANEIFV